MADIWCRFWSRRDGRSAARCETVRARAMKSWSGRSARRPIGRPRSPTSMPWFTWRRAFIISMKSMRCEIYRDVNIDGTLHLARCAADAGVQQFIFVSTVLVHGRSNDGRAPFSENDILTPRGLYGMSKAAAEAGLRNIASQKRDARHRHPAAARLWFGCQGKFCAAEEGREDAAFPCHSRASTTTGPSCRSRTCRLSSRSG